MLTSDINSEYLQWGLLLLAPLLAVFTAKGVYNAVCLSRAKERRHEQDARYDLEYRQWWSYVLARKGLQRVFCPRKLEPDEKCYASFNQVSVFSPKVSSSRSSMIKGADGIDAEVKEGTRFDMGCGVPVRQDWSVFDWFPSLSFRDRCVLCITDRCLYLKGNAVDLCLDLDDIHAVAASCSSVLIEMRSENSVPLLLGAVNGQIVRDVLHLLIERNAEIPPM